MIVSQKHTYAILCQQGNLDQSIFLAYFYSTKKEKEKSMSCVLKGNVHPWNFKPILYYYVLFFYLTFMHNFNYHDIQ